jgi:phenylacetate-CoA ligase
MQKFMNWKTLSHMPRREYEELQNKKLRAFLRYQIYPYHPHYRRLFREKGIDVYDIRNTDDLRKIPFTSKGDIAPTVKEPKRYMDFILQPDESSIKKYAPKAKLVKIALKKIIKGEDAVKQDLYYEYKPVHMHFTTGRTALPTPMLYTSYDMDMFREGAMRLFDVFEVPQDYIGVSAFPYAPHMAFWLAYHAGLRLKITALHSGGGKILGTQNIINAIERMGANIVVAIPGYAYHMVREAHEQKRDFSSLKIFLFGGERVPLGLKEKMREMLEGIGAKNPKIRSTYATTETKCGWGECTDDSGYHTYPDFEFIETIDPKTGERVDEGEEGEVVYTALDWRGSVVLRYRTGDITREGMMYEKCECGRTVPRIGGDIQRSSDVKEFNLSKIKGTLVNLNAFFPTLMGCMSIIEWQVEIRKKNNDPFEVDEIIVYVTPRKGTHDVEKEISALLLKEMEVTPNEIIFLPLQELVERLGVDTELKERRLVDLRPKL